MTTLPTPHDDIVIRRAYPDDEAALVRLATLDSAPAVTGPALLAEQGGELRAALDLDRGAIVADPFRRTAHLAELLRTQATPHRPATGPSLRSPRTLLRALGGPATPLDQRAV